MRTTLLIATLALVTWAEEPKKPEPTVASLQAEITLLKAQLTEIQTLFQLEQQVCATPEIMRARLARIEAAAKVEVANKPAPATAPKPATK